MPTHPRLRQSSVFRFGRGLSLERKLPLLMTGALAIVLAISLALTYRTLTDAARDAAATRLSRAAQQLASSIEASVGQRATRQRTVARDSAIQRVLRDAQSASAPGSAPSRPALDSARAMTAARAALDRLSTPTDSGLPIELWTDDGRPLIRLGRDSLSGMGTPELPEASPSLRATGTGIVRADSVRVGEFYESGGRVFFGISTPVYDGNRRIGYLAEKHRVAAQPNTERGLRALIGEDVTARYRNRAGAFWTTVGGVQVAPLRRPASSDPDLVYEGFRADVGPLFATEAAIAGTPWVIVLEQPMSTVFARPRATMARLGLLSVLLLVASAVASWVISKRITRPLATLSAAAQALARGDVSRPVDDSGGDEVAQLARTFSEMRDEISASRSELEAQVEEAQSVTEELEQVNEQLREAMEAAELANRAKGDFLAVMSHELRTPLNAIGGYMQILELEVHGPVNHAQRETLARATRSQQRLLTLINDVLNFARLDAGRVEYNWSDFSLDTALAALEPLIAPQVRAKTLTYTYAPCDPSLTVHADQDRLQQVVLNLLTNAIKFTPKGGSIAVDVEIMVDSARIRVRDSGMGIPPDRMRAIFEPFVQVDRSLNRPHEGVGLGLSISRDLARAMGGDLTVESELGKGSVFTVKVRRTRPSPVDDASMAWAPTALERAATTGSRPT